MDKSSVITIFKTEGDPEVYLANETKENGPADMAAVTAYVQAGAGQEKYNVIIKADRDVPTGFIDEVARAANEADLPGGELKFYFGVVDRPRQP
jgi:biopolymer transport protein ExbD